MPRALKVFRTPIGFHDAYIAAPSKKAAMEAWGTDRNLFARGEAEEVTDPALTAEPMASPGTVIKRLRGTADEQIAALAPHVPEKRPKASKAAKPKKPKPRPSRAALDVAEQALSEAETRYREELQAIAEREAALERQKKSLQAPYDNERSHLERKLQAAREKYDEAISRWRE